MHQKKITKGWQYVTGSFFLHLRTFSRDWFWSACSGSHVALLRFWFKWSTAAALALSAWCHNDQAATTRPQRPDNSDQQGIDHHHENGPGHLKPILFGILDCYNFAALSSHFLQMFCLLENQRQISSSFYEWQLCLVFFNRFSLIWFQKSALSF